MPDFTTQQGDASTPLTLYLTDRDGNIPNFRNGDNSLKTVKFYGWKRGDVTFTWLNDKTGVVATEAEGKVTMAGAATPETNTPGLYYVVVKLVDNAGKAETFPSDGYATVKVGDLPG